MLRKIVPSSVAQQLINAGLGILKLRVLYDVLPAMEVGKFALYTSMFYIVHFLFDSTRKTILSQVNSENAVMGNPKVNQMIKRDAITLVTIAVLFYFFNLVSPQNFSQEDFYCLISILLTTLLFSFANSISSLYSIRFGFHMLSILTGFSHILAFPLFVFCADTGSIPLLIFVNFIGNFLPGLLVLRKVTGVIRRDAFYEVVGFRSSPNWFLGIQLAETSANSLNASLVYSRLGDVATGEYLLYSKFALLYDFIPISLIPIVVSKRNHKNSNDKLLTFIVVANGVLISLIIFGIFGPTITVLSAGNITPSLVQLCPFMFGGFVISATSLYIQGAVRDEIIPFRLKASMITTMVNILATFIFLPIVGVSATYAMTGLTTGLYALLLSRKIKQLSNGN